MGDEASTRVEATADELRRMQAMVREAMDAGAIGLASSFSPNHAGFAGRPMPSTIAPDAELRALAQPLGEKGRGIFVMATGARATTEFMESLAADTGRPAFMVTVLTMYNDAAPDVALGYYERCAAARARGHEVYIHTSCQPLSFDFTLRNPYLLLLPRRLRPREGGASPKTCRRSMPTRRFAAASAKTWRTRARGSCSTATGRRSRWTSGR